MIDWLFLGALAAGGGFLAGRQVLRRNQQERAAHAAGLAPAHDLSHLPQSLQRTALWSLADGGFERRVITGVLARPAGDIEVTAFDLETLRDRRGEWAWLPIDVPFRIGEVVSVVACTVDRAVSFPHLLLKYAGLGDELRQESFLERGVPLHPGDSRGFKLARDVLRVGKSFPAEMPPGLPDEHVDSELPPGWRAYTREPKFLASLLTGGLAHTLETARRRDLVLELVEHLVLVYPAQRDVIGADAMADLTTTALDLVDGILAATRPLSPRGAGA